MMFSERFEHSNPFVELYQWPCTFRSGTLSPLGRGPLICADTIILMVQLKSWGWSRTRVSQDVGNAVSVPGIVGSIPFNHHRQIQNGLPHGMVLRHHAGLVYHMEHQIAVKDRGNPFPWPSRWSMQVTSVWIKQWRLKGAHKQRHRLIWKSQILTGFFSY